MTFLCGLASLQLYDLKLNVNTLIKNNLSTLMFSSRRLFIRLRSAKMNGNVI